MQYVGLLFQLRTLGAQGLHSTMRRFALIDDTLDDKQLSFAYLIFFLFFLFHICLSSYSVVHFSAMEMLKVCILGLFDV